MNWDRVFPVVVFGLMLFGMGLSCGKQAAPTDDLTQREVVLGDGTKATCIVVRDAGVTCVPHVVLGPDTEGGE